MRDRGLNDQRFDAVRMRECHTETHGSAIILHVERVSRKAEHFDEVIHDFGVVVERVCEGSWIRPIAMPKSRIVRRDQMEMIGEPGEEWLEHSRRRGQPVEQKNRWAIRRPCFPIKNGESVNLRRAIENVLRHSYF